MTVDVIENRVNTRVHAIVLTRDRPGTLCRCVATALSSLGAQDMLTILDDSVPTNPSANTALPAVTPGASVPTRVHLSMLRAREVIARSLSAPSLLWLTKTASRDIAPLRNLSLLLSVAVPADTTVFIDDDIYGFDLVATHRRMSVLAQTSRSVIAGADIAGISEQDTVTQLTHALDGLAKLPPSAKTKSIRDLLDVPVASSSVMGSVCRYVSGGYLAFRLPPERLSAFPPGYNEDWLWCLLHGGDPQLPVLRLGESVIHDPPSVRKPTREDFFFELVGDLVFDCLEEQDGGVNDFDPEAAIMRLSERQPNPVSLPRPRSMELVQKARSLNQNEGAIAVLEEYGLDTLADMLQTQELDIDGSQILIDWCRDAIAKQRSVAMTLHDESAIPALKALLEEGRL